MIPRSKIVKVARSFVGTPVVHQGRLPGVGLDCGGVLECTSTKTPGLTSLAGVATHYPVGRLAGLRLYRMLRKHMDEIPVAERLPGSVMLWWVNTRISGRAPLPQHVGIWLGAGIVHAEVTARKVVEVSYGAYWSSREYAAFDFRLLGAQPAHRIDERCVGCTDDDPCGCG